MSAFRTVPADGPVRLVQIGAGAMGQAWLSTIAANPDARLVGLVDIDVEHARRVAAERGLDVVVGADALAVAAEAGGQAIVNVTVPPAHHPVNTAALFAGLPVLCEKPIAPTVSETLSLVAAAELSGELLMTSQSRRYYPSLAAYREAISRIGGAGILATEFFRGPHFGGFREEMEHPLLVDMAIHGFDVARMLLDGDPVEVDCRSFNPAWSWFGGDASAVATFVFDDGARFSYVGSWVSEGLETSWNGRWRASGPRGSATWDGEDEVRVTTADAEEAPAPVDGPREIAGSLAEFLDVLRSGRTPATEVHTNAWSLAMVEAAVRSAETATTVRLADVLDDGLRRAIADERRDDVRERLSSWGSAARHLAVRA